MIGNDIDEDIQWRKLELVGRVADASGSLCEVDRG